MKLTAITGYPEAAEILGPFAKGVAFFQTLAELFEKIQGNSATHLREGKDDRQGDRETTRSQRRVFLDLIFPTRQRKRASIACWSRHLFACRIADQSLQSSG